MGIGMELPHMMIGISSNFGCHASGALQQTSNCSMMSIGIFEYEAACRKLTTHLLLAYREAFVALCGD